jgi:hypothetical protein
VISTIDQDCLPNLAPQCDTSTSFVNEENECVTKDSCVDYYKCPGEGLFDETLNSCFCDNVDSNPNNYCDRGCKKQALKAYFTKTESGETKVILKAGD